MIVTITPFISNGPLNLKGYFSNKACWKNVKIFKMTATVFQSGNLQGNINLKRNEVISYADGDFAPCC